MPDAHAHARHRALAAASCALALAGCSLTLDSSEATFAGNAAADAGAGMLPEPELLGGSFESFAALIKASNAEARDQFGAAVALYGTTIAAGAPSEASGGSDREDDSAPECGAVYVYERSARGVVEQAYLKPDEPETGMQFHAVALWRDLLAVGAPFGAAPFADRAGRVYVFERAGGRWTRVDVLSADNGEFGDGFGVALALAGDTLIIGAPGESSAGSGGDDDLPRSGAVYVFERADGRFEQRAYLKATTPGAGDGFGSALALDGDTLAIGAPGESSSATGIDASDHDNSASGSGAVYVFERAALGFVQQAFIKAEDPGGRVLDSFGTAVALSSETLAVGAPREDGEARRSTPEPGDDSATDTGAVFVFERSAGAWSQVQYLKAENGDPGDLFGGAVALLGDRLVASATLESGGVAAGEARFLNDLSRSGAVYCFERRAGRFVSCGMAKASNPTEEAFFGSSLALGPGTLAIGALAESSGGSGVDPVLEPEVAPRSGAVYVIDLR